MGDDPMLLNIIIGAQDSFCSQLIATGYFQGIWKGVFPVK